MVSLHHTGPIVRLSGTLSSSVSSVVFGVVVALVSVLSPVKSHGTTLSMFLGSTVYEQPRPPSTAPSFLIDKNLSLRYDYFINRYGVNVALYVSLYKQLINDMYSINHHKLMQAIDYPIVVTPSSASASMIVSLFPSGTILKLFAIPLEGGEPSDGFLARSLSHDHRMIIDSQRRSAIAVYPLLIVRDGTRYLLYIFITQV